MISTWFQYCKLVLLNILLLHFISPATAQSDALVFINEDIQLMHLGDSIFVHITWENSSTFGRFSSNGMIIIRNGQALMIDTPMDNAKTKILTEYILNHLHANVEKVIVGHYHDDCLGGLSYLHERGVTSIANILTVEKCKEMELQIPSKSFNGRLTFNFQNETVVCSFPGAGHTFDNIVVWLPNHKILFGGCFIKAAKSTNLGNLEDAVVGQWNKSIENVKRNFPAEIVIPGHGDHGGKELLTHTQKLVDEYLKQQKKTKN